MISASLVFVDILLSFLKHSWLLLTINSKSGTSEYTGPLYRVGIHTVLVYLVWPSYGVQVCVCVRACTCMCVCILNDSPRLYTGAVWLEQFWCSEKMPWLILFCPSPTQYIWASEYAKFNYNTQSKMFLIKQNTILTVNYLIARNCTQYH